MPQMAPISWLILFLIFSILFILFTILNYFSAIPSPLQSSEASTIKSSDPYQWQW